MIATAARERRTSGTSGSKERSGSDPATERRMWLDLFLGFDRRPSDPSLPVVTDQCLPCVDLPYRPWVWIR